MSEIEIRAMDVIVDGLIDVIACNSTIDVSKIESQNFRNAVETYLANVIAVCLVHKDMIESNISTSQHLNKE